MEQSENIAYDILLIGCVVYLWVTFIFKHYFFDKERIISQNAPVIFLPMTVLFSFSILGYVIIHQSWVPLILYVTYHNIWDYFCKISWCLWFGIAAYAKYTYLKKNKLPLNELYKAIFYLCIAGTLILFI